MPSSSSIFEEQRARITQIEHHYGVRNRACRDIDAGFGDHRRGVDQHIIFGVFWCKSTHIKDGVGRFFFRSRLKVALVPVF